MGDGLYGKYRVEKDGERVTDCFVLEPEDDAAAREALEAYADATDDSGLAADLRVWARQTSDDPERSRLEAAIENSKAYRLVEVLGRE